MKLLLGKHERGSIMRNVSRPVRVVFAILTGLFIFSNTDVVYAQTEIEKLINNLSHPEDGFSQSELVVLIEKMTTAQGKKEPSWCYETNTHITTFGSGSPYSIIGTTSLNMGVEYYRTHKAFFDQAQTRFPTVPSEIILAILRLETYFGRCMGNNIALPTLVREYLFYQNKSSLRSQARKAQAFRDIQALIHLCRKQQCNPNALQSSWAGALGPAQFLPSSIAVYGVDGDGDGMVNIYTHADSILSISRYLLENGWFAGNRATQKHAVWLYNHSSAYVSLVFRYAGAIRTLIQ